LRILGSTALSFGILLLAVSSYAWWGSANSPLGLLFWPAVGLIVGWFACRVLALAMVRWVHVHRGRHFARQMRSGSFAKPLP
jgi:hypothetical protein